MNFYTQLHSILKIPSHLGRVSVLTTYFKKNKNLSASEIEFILRAYKALEGQALETVMDVMNIAGPSGTNKQLPKPLPAAWTFKEWKQAWNTSVP